MIELGFTEPSLCPRRPIYDEWQECEREKAAGETLKTLKAAKYYRAPEVTETGETDPPPNSTAAASRKVSSLSPIIRNANRRKRENKFLMPGS
jgi:hypothetical protein